VVSVIYSSLFFVEKKVAGGVPSPTNQISTHPKLPMTSINFIKDHILTNCHNPPIMSQSNPPGGRSSDVVSAKSWDREEYAKKAADDEAKRKAEGKARYEAKLLGKKYHAPVDYDSLEATTARKERLNVSSQVGKTTIVPAGASMGKKGKGAGFYCQDCDLTFKDNIQFVEHLNSKQHLIATGQSGEVVRAGVKEVRTRLRMLAKRKRDRDEEERKAWQLDLGERLRDREEQDAKEREEKRRKRNEKRRKGGVKEEDNWEGRLGIIA
jgi:U4/U6.U5 tri-snRNP component SNU23